MSQQPPKRPEVEFRAVGNGVVISAAVWRNEQEREGQTIVSHSVRIQKRYYDKQTGEWKNDRGQTASGDGAASADRTVRRRFRRA